MAKYKRFEYKGLLFYKIDFLILVFIFLLIAFGRVLEFWLADKALIIISANELKGVIFNNALFYFVPISGIILYYFGFKGYAYRGIITTVLTTFFLSVVFAFASFTTSIIFNVCSLIVLCAAIYKGFFKNIKKINGVIITMLSYSFASILLYSVFIENNAYRFGRLLSVFYTGLDAPRTPYDFLLSVIRKSTFSFVGQVSFPVNSQLTVDGLLSGIAVNPHFMLTFVLMRFGIIFAAFIALIYLFLCISMWSFTLRQKDSLGFIISFSITLSITVRYLFYILSNFGIIYLNTELPFISGTIISLIIDALLICFIVIIMKEMVVNIKKEAHKHNDSPE